MNAKELIANLILREVSEDVPAALVAQAILDLTYPCPVCDGKGYKKSLFGCDGKTLECKSPCPACKGKGKSDNKVLAVLADKTTLIK